MKHLFTLFLCLIVFQTTIAQSCGKYSLRIVGKISSDSLTAGGLQLPTTSYLHGYSKQEDKNSFFRGVMENGMISDSTTSALGTVFKSPEALLKVYKAANETFTFKVVTLSYNYIWDLRTVEIPWDQIVVRLIKNEGISPYFELNLGTVVL